MTARPAAPTAAILRLDPRRTLVWRDPTTLQVGVDPVVAMLDHIDDAELRLVESLAVGVTRERLHAVAAHLGVRRERFDGLLEDLGVALEPAPMTAASAEPIAVIGQGLGAERVAGVLAESGHPVALAPPGAPIAPRTPLAVLVSTQVIDPLEHARWLRRDRPHVPIVFGEVAVTIGPLVLPGESACLRCVEQHRALDDPARSVLATQLWGRPAAAETPTVALAAGLSVLRMLRARTPGTSVRIDAATGDPAPTTWHLQPDCGCRGLSPRAVAAPRREIGSGPARRASAPGAAPTTARALVAHG